MFLAIRVSPHLRTPAPQHPSTRALEHPSTPVLQHLSTFVIVLILITLIQIALGTQVRGGVDTALDAGVARDAALATVGNVDYLHRDAAFITLLGAILLTFWLARQSNPTESGDHRTLVRWSWGVLSLAALQVAVGAVMAYVSLLPAAQVVHLTLASLLLGAETVLLLMSWRESV